MNDISCKIRIDANRWWKHWKAGVEHDPERNKWTEKLIESQGFMVVEFKLWYRKLGEMILEYAVKVIDTWKAIVLFIQEQAIKAFKHIKDFVEQLSNELEPYMNSLDYMDCEKRNICLFGHLEEHMKRM